MNSNTLRRLCGVLLAVLILAGPAVPVSASGKMVKIRGSDTVLPLAQAWAEAYMAKNPDAVISVTGGGSGVGIASLINGACDVANASRAAQPKEISQARDRNIIMKATTVAKDGIAVIVNPKNPIKGVSMSQLAKLYSRAQTWKEIGGDSVKVVTVGRDSSSGTHVFFRDTVLKGKRYRPDMLTLPSNSAICQTISQDEGAIGHVGLAFAKEYAAKHKVKIIEVNGLAASDETVANGKYVLWRPLYCYTKGRPGGVIGDYLKFVTSAEGQKIAEKVGFVAIR